LQNGRRLGVEIKLNEAPKITRSMRIALADLELDHLWVIYPGEHLYPADEKITMCPLQKVIDLTASANW